jgi:hypothetical protein
MTWDIESGQTNAKATTSDYALPAMHRRIFIAVFAGLALSPNAASALVDEVAPPGGGLGALAVHVDLVGARVQYQSCPQAPCSVGPQSPAVPITADRATLPTPGEVSTEVVEIGGGKHVVHVRIPVLGGSGPGAPAWEGIIASGTEPLFAGVTGWTRGEPGERSGVALQWLGDGGPKTVAKGDVQEELGICGDEVTLLKPQGLDPVTLAWRGASLQRLPSARREKAQRLVASARGGAPADIPLAPLLTAQGASTAIGEPKALSDGDPETTWSEARPGQGQGEFVLFRAPHEVPVTRFAIAVAPKVPRAEGAAPRTFYLATDVALFEVTMPEDAWMHAGAAYDVPLPEPITTSCLALVLGEAYTHGNPKPEVTVAELYAYSAFDAPGANLDTVARALSGGGPRAEAAAGVLKRAGVAGLDAAALVYSSLDPAGRALAVDVAAASPSCAVSSRLLAPALSDGDHVVREKARAKLEEPHCGKDAVPALVAALGADATRARAATVLASVAASVALGPLSRVLGQGSVRDRATVRSAFAHAAAAGSGAEVAAILAEARDPEARVELLRASEARLGDAREAADKALDEVFASSPTFRTRYLLAAPVAALARAGDPKGDERLVLLLAHDAEAPVRVRAAELAGASAKTQSALDAATKDPEPRVREAALRTVAASKVVAAEGAAIVALAGDPWTFVRAEAAAALAALPASGPSDEALGRALEDKTSRVRAAAIAALAGHAATAFAGSIRARLADRREDLDVRVAAAHALGSLCDARAVDDLAGYAVNGASSPNPDEVALGLAATDALGQIHPADLVKRLKSVHSKGARPDAQRAANAAVGGRGTCH